MNERESTPPEVPTRPLADRRRDLGNGVAFYPVQRGEQLRNPRRQAMKQLAAQENLTRKQLKRLRRLVAKEADAARSDDRRGAGS